MFNEIVNVTNFLLSMLLAVFFLYIFYGGLWLKRRTLYFCVSELARLLVAPLVGSHQGQRGLVDRFLRLCKYTYPRGKIWLGFSSYIMITEPETLEMLMKKHLEKGALYRHLEQLVGKSIFMAPVDIWKTHRKILNVAFNRNNLISHMDCFKRFSKQFLENLGSCKNGEVDVFHEFFRYNLRITSELVMGENTFMTADYEAKVLTSLQRGQVLFAQRTYNPLYQSQLIWKISGRAKEEADLLAFASNFVDNLVKWFEEKRSTFDNKQILSLLLASRDEHGLWSDASMAHEILVFFLGGSETSATVSSFAVLMLALHQDIQTKVYEEQIEIFENTNRDVTFEDLQKMKYLDRVIKETLRLFPPAPIIFREFEEVTTLGKYSAPSGSSFAIPILFIQRNPVHWPTPMKFDPDRFLAEEVAKRPRYTYLPFSIAPRNCIGMKFADMAIKVSLSQLIRKFRIHTKQYTSVESISLAMNLFLSARNGYNVTLVPRHECDPILCTNTV